MKRAVIYLRVSTIDQAHVGGEAEGYSIPAQREACHRKAESLGASVVDEYVDRGESAKTADRPQLLAMLQRLRMARDIDYVIVHKIDRLARNRADDSQIVLTIRQAGADLVSVTENIDDTPEGKLLHGIMAVFAEHYSLNLAREAKKGMRQKAKLGGTPNKAPVGYLNVRAKIDGREVRTVAVDPERAPLVQWAFSAYASGQYSIEELTNELEARGLTAPYRGTRGQLPINRSHVHTMLRNRYYLGVVRFEGVEYPGKHEALIDLNTFERCAATLEAHRLSGDRTQKHEHYLKGSIFCGYCGQRLMFSRNKGRGGTYDYFCCLGRTKGNGCKQPYIATDVIEDKVQAYWSKVQLSDARCCDIESAVRQHVTTAKGLIESETDRQKQRTARLDRERRKLLQAHYDDAIAPDLFRSEQQRITAELESAQKILESCEVQFETIERNLQELLDLATNAEKLYQAAGPTDRRLLNQAVFEKLWIIDDEVVGVDMETPFAQLLTSDLPERAEQETRALREGTYGNLVDGTERAPSEFINDVLNQPEPTTERPPYTGEARTRRAETNRRHLIVGEWGAAIAQLQTPATYFRAKPGRDLPVWLTDPILRPFGALPLERANPEATSMARGSNVVLLVGVPGLEPGTNRL